MPTDASVSVSLSARIPNVSQLTDLLGDLKTKVGAVQVPDIPVARIEELAGRFSISVPDTTSWPAAIPRDALAALERLPDAAALVKPLTEPLARVQRILAFPVNDELKRIEEALAALTPASLASPEELVRGLIDPLSHVTAFLQGSELVKLAGAVATLLGATDAERFPRDAAAAVADLQALLRDRVAAAILAVTGLASVSTTVIRTERLVGVIGSTFSLDATNARYQDVLRAYGEGPDGLAAGIAGLDVADASQVAAMHGRLSGARQTFETLQLSLVRDLAFSEASLMVLNTGALQASLEKTAAALGALQTDQIKALAASVQTIAADLTAGFTVDPTLTLDEFRKLLGEGFGHARTTVDRIDLGGIRNLLRSLLDVIQQPFKALQDLKDAVESLTRSAMAELQQALSAIDLGALQRGADQFLDRLGDQLAELERLSSDLRGAIEGVLQEAAAALEALRQALLDPENGLKKQIQGVFESVFALLDGLGIQGAVDEVTGVLQPVTVELGKIEFAPVFDATADALETVNDVLRTVAPLLVTEDLKKKLGEATAFLRQIDFDEIAKALNDTFDEILAAVDEDALGKVTLEYGKVIEAIDRFDPAPALEQLQKEAFAPVIAELEKVDPSALLEPLVGAFASASEGLRSFDPAKTLAFATEFFDELRGRFQQISPEKLLEPVESALSDLKDRIDRLLKIDDALDLLGQASEAFRPVVEAIAVGPVLDQMAEGFRVLRAELDTVDPADVVAPFVTLLEAALARAGALVNGAGIVDALLAVVNQGAAVEDRIRALPRGLSSSAAAIGRLDVAAMLSAMRARHGGVKAALHAHPAGSSVALEFELDLAALDPVPIFTSIGVRSTRVAAAFREKDEALTALVAALEPQLRPIGNVRDALASFLAAFDTVRAAVMNPFRALMGRSDAGPRELLGRFLDEIDPQKWRPSLEPVLNALHGKVIGMLSDVVLNPIAEAAGSLKSITGLLDVSTLIQPVVAVFDEIEQMINQLDPTPIVRALDDRYRQLLAALDNLNPAPFVAEIQQLYADGLIGVLKAISPAELLLPPLRELFARIKGLLVSLDVEVLFKPILERLRALKVQLVEGLTRTGAGYTQMLATLDSAGGGVSVSVSVRT